MTNLRKPTGTPYLLPKPVQIKHAKTVSGRSRGTRLGFPTINIDLVSAPQELAHGIYACWIFLNDQKYMGAMHYGDRPVFQDTKTFEVHVIDGEIRNFPEEVDVDVIARLREVLHFETTEALQEAIATDILNVRAILKKV